MYVALEAAKADPVRPGALRYGISGGASLPLAVMDKFRDVFGVEIHEGYGLTETSPVAAFNHVGTPPRPGTIGVAIWGVDIEIARAETVESIELLPPGELGELVIRGTPADEGLPQPARGHGRGDRRRWFRTGDLATRTTRLPDDLDRKKDMIIRNGITSTRARSRSPLTHPRCSGRRLGSRGRAHGEEVAAAIVLRPGRPRPGGPDLRSERKLAAYKYPRIIRLLAELPLGPSGRFQKRTSRPNRPVPPDPEGPERSTAAHRQLRRLTRMFRPTDKEPTHDRDQTQGLQHHRRSRARRPSPCRSLGAEGTRPPPSLPCTG